MGVDGDGKSGTIMDPEGSRRSIILGASRTARRKSYSCLRCDDIKPAQYAAATRTSNSSERRLN
jgi:hypothetical protein